MAQTSASTPLAVDSDGVEYPESPRPTAARYVNSAAGKGRRRGRRPGSRGWWEAQRRLDQALNAGLSDIRNNAHHHVSRELVRKYHTMGIETLNVSGMIRAGLQSRALSDAGMSGLLDQIRYKANWYDTAPGRSGPVVSQQQDLLRLAKS